MMDAALITAWATVGIIGATLLVGGANCVLIWRGIKAKDHSSAERPKDRREARETDLRRHHEAMDEGRRRHDETMAALRALLERMAPAPTERAGEAD